MEKEYAPSAKEKKMTKAPVAKAQAPAQATKVEKHQEAKEEKKEEVHSHAHDHSHDHAHEHKAESKPVKVESKPVVKKEEAIANGVNLHLSKKHCMYIGKFIKNKSIDAAIADLNKVLKFKAIVPFKGEIPHRKGPGMMSGRYPINASKAFINMLKGLKGNAIVNGLDLDKTKIYYCSASWASRPMKSGGARFKRTHVLIKAKEITKNG